MIKAAWIEIPTKDIERAAKFYQAVFELEPAKIEEDGVRRYSTLLMMDEAGKPGISLTQTANFEPGTQGILVYLDASPELTPCLNRVEPAGGTIISGKASLDGGDNYNYAVIQDTEGNELALYSFE